MTELIVKKYTANQEASDDAEKQMYLSTSAYMEALMDDRSKLDLFCIATFCLVEEVYTSSAVIEPIRKRRSANKGFSDIELITMVIVGEANGQSKGKKLYRWVG
jgi:hypothetical protein